MKQNIRLILAAVLVACSTISVQAKKYAGGDISLMTYLEDAGATYYTNSGTKITNTLQFFADEGHNAMRVRLFVDPDKYAGDADATACQDLDYVKVLAKRIKDAGFALVLDFHYSDSWADPAKQWTPTDWEDLSDSELYTQIYNYTKECLETLVDYGATPDFIQIGNEISYGMLWGAYGSSSLKKCYINSTDNWERFTTLLNKASAACREVCPNAGIIVHVERTASSAASVLKNFYTQMASYDVDYDIIGLSFYPEYHGEISALETAIKNCSSYGKDIMIVETGYAINWKIGGDYDLSSTYPYTDDGQLAYTEDLIEMLNQYEIVTGLFWWNMDYNAYKTSLSGWWNAPLFDSQTGKATQAISVLKDFIGDENDEEEDTSDTTDSSNTTAIEAVEAAENAEPEVWYTLSGIKIDKPTAKGIYICNGKKIVL